MNIGKDEVLLDSQHFFRVNRSVIINLGFLVSLDRKRCNCLISMDGKETEFLLPFKRGNYWKV